MLHVYVYVHVHVYVHLSTYIYIYIYTYKCPNRLQAINPVSYEEVEESGVGKSMGFRFRV